MGGCSQQRFTISSPLLLMQQSDGGDIPTWYPGDQWVYKIDPLYVSSPNGTFSGTIQNFKQKVVGVMDGWYTIDITGQISGDIIINGVPGQVNGQITGASSFRVSDLAEGGTELYSQGTITMMYIPFPYEMTFVTNSFPPLELYDFPLYIGEQWQITCITSASGSMSIQGLYEQSFNGSQWVEETVTCLQKNSITVPAGTFECYEIGRSRSENNAWYSTEVGNIVKSVINQSDENMTIHLVMSLQSFSHAVQPITISEEITPAMVLPGDSVVISGQAISSGSGTPIQDGVIIIQIPATGDSWTTTTNAVGYYSKTIVAPTMIDDTPSGRETGSGGVIVQCTSESLLGYRVKTLTTLHNTPPEIPSIQGPETGNAGVSYSYTFITEDPESDEVFYFVDWGDGTNSGWLGPSPSNEDMTLSHTFTEKGSYTIKVKARDVFYAESDWGTLQVTMPKQLFSSHFPRFFIRFPLICALLERFLGN